ncbi:hypothetical protein B0A54_16572 [Friedmanniomyces endolithicus]|uniref:Uncharacterized protein n=1 Tax=Friedmanniomyces endolithicus TaxID=329885 RepID=A0A4U0UAU0_9PEZI|nr:hypothetical protein B0A54_16572 [Friedmanniomyces endolithicus]
MISISPLVLVSYLHLLAKGEGISPVWPVGTNSPESRLSAAAVRHVFKIENYETMVVGLAASYADAWIQN